ncbi:MAG TPA: FYDLN acid domain-containing protein [Thermoanaerobaculia bacterium]
MPELKLGSKYECYNCGTKFYDLGKSEPLCPKCGANQKDAATSEPAAGQASRRRRKAEVAKPLEIEEEEVAPIADIGDEEMVGPELEEVDLGGEAEEEEDLDDEA